MWDYSQSQWNNSSFILINLYKILNKNYLFLFIILLIILTGYTLIVLLRAKICGLIAEIWNQITDPVQES